jgi:hypothetical protein
MLDLPRYLLGIAEVALLVGFAAFGASAIRSRLLPGFRAAPAHLATAVIALAILIWVAEVLGSFGLLKAVPYVLLVGLAGLAAGIYLRGRPLPTGGAGGEQGNHPPSALQPTPGRYAPVPTAIALMIAAAAAVHFAAGARLRLTTGMTGFDSTWYHGPFAAGFFQTGDTLSLHFIAPQFLAWFYPANSELLHSIGMVAFGRDILSPLMNLGWFGGCLLAAWCIGRPFGVAPISLALAAVALNTGALADQAGEARNDIVGIFFLLAALAIALNASVERRRGEQGLPVGALAVAGLAAGLAAGTKLNFLLPAAAIVAGMVVIARGGDRWRALAAGGLSALAGGGYWYLRNLLHTGNPLPWVRHLGPLTLPAPGQALGGREAHSVFGYLANGSVWSDWLLPGFHHGLGPLWPLLAALALAGLALCLARGASPTLRVASVAGLSVLAAWLIAPTSASGPDGIPRGFESGLRYLAPALVLGMALLPVSPLLRDPLARLTLGRGVARGGAGGRARRTLGTAIALAVVAAIALGYPIQRHYLENRYSDPAFTTPGLNAAFRWARTTAGDRIATTSTRQYPLFGTDLSNRVQFIGAERPHGGFAAPTTCREWRRLLDDGNYDFVVASRDRVEPGKPAYPPAARWTEGPGATVVLRRPPTVVFKLSEPPDPSTCP